MPQPTGRDLRVDRVSTQISIAYRNLSMIADLIFPIVTVMQQSGIVPQYDQSHWFRDEAKLRAPGTKAERVGYSVDLSMKYYCPRYSIAKEVYDKDPDNSEAPFNLDRDAVEIVTNKLQLRREIAFATDFMATAIWGSDKVGGTDFPKWSDYGTSEPIINIGDYMDLVESKIGVEAKDLVMGKLVWLRLKNHPDLIDLIKFTQRGQITVELLASLLDLNRIHIGRAIKTTDPEGTAEASVTYTRVWGKDALLIYVPARPSLLTPAAGYTFVWNRVANAIQYFRRLRDDEREADIFEGNTYYDQKVVGAKAGVFIDEAVA